MLLLVKCIFVDANEPRSSDQTNSNCRMEGHWPTRERKWNKQWIHCECSRRLVERSARMAAQCSSHNGSRLILSLLIVGQEPACVRTFLFFFLFISTHHQTTIEFCSNNWWQNTLHLIGSILWVQNWMGQTVGYLPQSGLLNNRRLLANSIFFFARYCSLHKLNAAESWTKKCIEKCESNHAKITGAHRCVVCTMQLQFNHWLQQSAFDFCFVLFRAGTRSITVIANCYEVMWSAADWLQCEQQQANVILISHHHHYQSSQNQIIFGW